jgi:hypothetical protein
VTEVTEQVVDLIHSMKKWIEVLFNDKKALCLEMVFYLGPQKRAVFSQLSVPLMTFVLQVKLSLCMS